jgi:uncharacterized protein (TIGR02147 family)
MITPFDYTSYKAFLIDLIDLHGNVRGYQGRLSEAAGCQPSYLSQALKGKQELSADHAFGIATHIGLSVGERNYFLTLTYLSKARGPKLRAYYENELHKLKAQQASLKTRLENERPKSEIEALYYSSWEWIAVHMLTSARDFQTPSSIGLRLGLPLERVEEVLGVLVELDLVSFSGGRYEYKKGTFHLPDDSPMIQTHHLQWRHKAMGDLLRRSSDSLHYSSAFTMSAEDYKRLKSSVLSMIEKGREIIGPSDAEELYSFSCDLFKV